MTRSFIAEVVITHPALPLTPTIRTVQDATVRVESQLAHRHSPSIFYSVTDTEFEKFERALNTDPTVASWEVNMEFSDCRIYLVNPSADAKFTTPKMVNLGVRVLSIRNTGEGWHFQLQAPDREALGAYWEYCREEDVRFSLEKIYRSGPQAAGTNRDDLSAILTARQREVARTVARMRYYDPDGASAEEVAAELEISPSTLSTHLRRIMAKVFDHMFREEEKARER